MASDNKMASALKRKRGQLEVVKPSKRSKSFHNISPSVSFGANKGRSSTTTGINGNQAAISEKSESLKAENFGNAIEDSQAAKPEKQKFRKEARPTSSAWKTSDPIGGRMIEVDPVFTEDEKFLIIAHRRAIHVYSTSNSLLHRSICLQINGPQKSLVHIVDYVLSPTESNIIWVACSNGLVYKIDWMLGHGRERSWKTSSNGSTHISVASMDSAGYRRDIVFTTEKYEGGWRIAAHELSLLDNSTTTQSRVIHTSTQRIQIIKAVDEGAIIVAASEERVLLGSLRSTNYGTVDKMRYEFRTFESTDFVSSLDARVSKRNSSKKSDKSKVVDVVVGDVKGVIFIHNDLLHNLIGSQKPANDDQHQISIIPRKLHWHRRAVHCVKWSLDGSYIISGGSETVLVLWQLDTGQQQYLPHLSATIQNIVVSPKGISYALHLGDNSTMLLSTSELVPTAYIAGIQAHVIGKTSPDSLVQRLQGDESGRPFFPRTPAVINPAHPEHILLAVGEAQELKPSSARASSAPFLQTFDVASNHNVSRQAMSRTNITNKNIAPSAHSISEPVIVQIQISHDGMWLATVDEWLPPQHDVQFLGHSGMDLEDEQRQRREVYLKFWQWNETDYSWALVSRIDAPHTLASEKHGAGRVLALSSDPSSHKFSTIGEDGMLQVWHLRIRKRDGVIVRGSDGKALCGWHCQHQISLHTTVWDDDIARHQEVMPSHASLAFSEDGSLLAAAMSSHENGLVYLIDPAIGAIHSSHSLMYRGDLIALAFSAQYLISLADEIRVWDLVLDELKYGVALGDAQNLLFLEQKVEMMHLEVDNTSHTFAIALPCSKGWKLNDKKYNDSLSLAYSEIAVFEPQNPVPVYTQHLQSLVTALLPATSSPGYIVLDATAEIITICPKATQSLTSIAKPIVELRLDIKAESQEAPGADLMQTADPEAEVEMEDESKIVPELDIIDRDDHDDGPPVVTSHQLSQVLDVGPSFALPPVEEMFYAVAGLLSSMPKIKAEVASSEKVS